MDLQRRLTLYLFGLIIGGALAYWFYGQRLTNAAWIPEERIKLRLRTTLVYATEEAAEQLAAWPATLADLRAAMVDNDVDVSATRRVQDTLYYTVDLTILQRPARLQIWAWANAAQDSTATLVGIVPR
jgi:hypothetical protein